jgi:3-oxoacyl-[acyl-carrier-protein] synthase II
MSLASERRQRRVVITGLGVISPIGMNVDAYWQALTSGTSGVVPVESLPQGILPAHFAGQVRDFTGSTDDFGELDKEVKKPLNKGRKLMCRETAMGVAAAQRALHHAGLVFGQYDPERIGVSFGAGHMMTDPEEFNTSMQACTEAAHFLFERWGNIGLKKVNPLWLLKYLPNMPACHVAIYNDLRGPNNSITQGDTAANLAIGEAVEVISRGSADIMVAGATGTRLHPLRTIHTALQEEVAPGANCAPEEASRPFDRDRAGMVIGEGAACVVLEELESALKRGVPIYAEVVGFGSSCVRSHAGVADRSKATANAVAMALRQAGERPDSVGHVHAHGLSTRTSDPAESHALHHVFNGRGSSIPVVAAKSNFGNLGAGSGAVELVASILALHAGHLFPVLNYKTPDPDCPISVVTDNGVEAGRLAINSSVTGSGQASCLLVAKYKA